MRKYLILALKGCAMGMADVVPGVSGGTIAFITGIYEELIASIKSIDQHALALLLKGQIGKLWKHVNGNFLAAVVSGIAISIFSLARVMTYLLDNHPILIWSFFFGLIIASALLVSRNVGKWNIKTIISMVVGCVVAYWITVASPAQTPDDWWFVMLAGAIAICAMILPGISGAFILLLMGKYQYILSAISNFEISTIAIFMAGAAIGIISFSHLLSWLLKNYHSVTISMLMGFMIGSLNKVWPWKETLETYLNSHGEAVPLVERNISPMEYGAMGGEAQLMGAICLAIIGFMVIYLFESWSAKHTTKQ